MRTVLIAQYSSNNDGSALSGLMLADGLKARGWRTCVLFRHNGPIVERFSNSGHEICYAPHNNWLRSEKIPQFIKHQAKERLAVRTIRPVLEDLAPDIVYVNTVASRAVALAARASNIPTIWHIRELFADVGGEMRCPVVFRKWVRRRIRYLSAAIIANSKAVAENVLGSEEGVEIVANGVSSSFFNDERSKKECRARFGMPDEAVIVGVPGTLRPMKGHPFLLRALSAMSISEPWLVAITGDGQRSYRAELERSVMELGMSNAVRFLGHVNDMAAFYKACDVVCVPSRAEPFGRIVIEAFAVGTPVVASAVGGIKEVVRDEENGILVEYGNDEQLGDAVARLVRDHHLAARLSRTALEEARSRYHEDVYSSTIGSIIERSLKAE